MIKGRSKWGEKLKFIYPQTTELQQHHSYSYLYKKKVM